MCIFNKIESCFHSSQVFYSMNIISMYCTVIFSIQLAANAQTNV